MSERFWLEAPWWKKRAKEKKRAAGARKKLKMKKTASSIEAGNEAKKKYRNGHHPNSHKPAGKRGAAENAEHLQLTRWKPGQSGNPSGRPKNDVAKEIARAIFEGNREALYKAYGKAALRGNAYAFTVLADRAYGKLKEKVEYDITPFAELDEEAIQARIRELEERLQLSGNAATGTVAGADGGVGGIEQAPGCFILPPSKEEN